jgi:hypothetical protein
MTQNIARAPFAGRTRRRHPRGPDQRGQFAQPIRRRGNHRQRLAAAEMSA